MTRGIRILIADDQPDVRALMRDVLELEGYAVEETADGSAALARMQTNPPDLLILDHMMPEITGIDVLRQLRSEGIEVPVIVLTAYGDDETTWAGWSAGASCFLDKPFDRDVLLQWVGRLIAEPTPDETGAQFDLGSHHSLGDADGPPTA